jgi:hypothetical protein
LREVVCPVLELREEKRTFVKVEGGKVDFFLKKKREGWISLARSGGWAVTLLPSALELL